MSQSQIDAATRLRLLQAIEHVLTQWRPGRAEIARLRDYGRTEVPNASSLDVDELATAVALRLLNVTEEELARLGRHSG
ncbi:MAG: hypothetical protein KGN84_20705 [Acidobacteriota bacterium]|nr:hypothetical protein [Acidobacteriota bacterium]